MQSAQRWIHDQVQECVHYALALRRATASEHGIGQGAKHLAEVGAAVDKMMVYPDETCRGYGLQKAHLDDIRYAVVAVLSEFAQVNPGDHRWQDELLRRGGFPLDPIGENFYTRIDSRLALFSRHQLDPSSESKRRDREANLAVLQLYAVCIALGFRGRYGASAGIELAKLQGYLQKMYKALGVIRLEDAPVIRLLPDRAHTWAEPRRLALLTGLMALLVSITYLSLRYGLAEQTASARELLHPTGEQRS